MSISISISGQMDNITTTIFQNTADQMFTGVIGLTALNYKNNVGHLMLALLSALGFVCSDDGKTLSHSSNPTAKQNWCLVKPARKKGSRRRTSQRNSVGTATGSGTCTCTTCTCACACTLHTRL